MKTGITFKDIIVKAKQYNTLNCICNDPDVNISGIRRLQPAKEYNDSFIYYGPLSDYEKCTNRKIENVLIYNDSPTVPVISLKGSNIIVTENREDLYNIICHVSDVFSFHSTLGVVSKELRTICTQMAPLNAVVKYLHETINNPILVTDITFKLLANYGTDVIKDEPDWEHAIENGYLSSDYVRRVINWDTNRESDSIYGGFVLEDKEGLGLNHSQVSSRIMYNGKIIGYIKVLEYNHDISDIDKEIISLAADLVAPIIQKGETEGASSNDNKAIFIKSLLDGNITNTQEILEREKLLNLSLKQALHLIVIPIDADKLGTGIVYNLTRKIEMVFSTSITVFYQSSIVVLFDTNNLFGDLMESDEIKQLFPLLENYKCCANISAPFYGIYKIARHYRQALTCQRIRLLINEKKPILNYQEIAIYHALLAYSAEQSLTNLLHPAVVQLYKLSEEKGNGDNLLETMFIYTANKCNLTDTANAMYVHYNTLRYRIAKISEITGVDFSNPNDVVQINLSRPVITMLKAINQNIY